VQNDPRIAATAYRHGIDSADILHAWRNVISAGIGTNDMDIAVGPAEDGTLLEIGFIRSGDEVVILHTMTARPKFLR
jgi:hypothetical protein